MGGGGGHHIVVRGEGGRVGRRVDANNEVVSRMRGGNFGPSPIKVRLFT